MILDPTVAKDWWRQAVVYQVYPRSFADTNGDGVGDLAGVTAKLPYVASLGVDGIWLSPFFTSPMRDFGYDVADHLGVDPLFGSGADLDALLAEADQAGTSPGKEALTTLLQRAAPCVVLLDELVAYVRQLEPGKSYPGGTFDSNITFIRR